QEQLKTLFSQVPPRPLAQPQQAGHVNRLIEEAIQQGARLLTPEGIPNDRERVYPPLVLVDVDPKMAICRAALFAPVVVLIPYEEAEKALEGLLQSDYGLGLSIFTADLARARKLASTLPAGLVTINDIVAPVAHPATPFGGVGRSGWGVTQGSEG